MRAEQKANVKNSIGRLVFVALSVLLQVVWIIELFIRLNAYSAQISLLSNLLAGVVVLRIYGKHTNAAFKMSWMILILVVPVLGLCVYALFGTSLARKTINRHFEEVKNMLDKERIPDAAILEELAQRDPGMANQMRYITDYAGYSVCKNTDIVFYREASDGFNAQLEAMERAEKFIFMEYHAIEEASSFERLKQVLAKKAAAGVEVRVFYDDIGSIGFINRDFIKRMETLGIQCRVFNPIMPLLNVFMNNRDHRKITVIDNKIGFTGGYNLADEYFNITHPYGYWKDTGVRLTGDAVTNLTMMFLDMWNAMAKTDTDYGNYLQPAVYKAHEQQAYVQPYADSPLDGEPVGENVYLNLIKYAKYKLYLTTPYLIISDEMNRELGLAAKRGVDVRIITPGIPDKKMIYKMTRSYYAGLAVSGVRIYEYTPGFVHAKQFLCDDDAATVGTINMDYRSLYHHFENGVLLYDCEAVSEISKDFDSMLEESHEVTAHYSTGRSTMLRIGQCLLRLAAPLL